MTQFLGIITLLIAVPVAILFTTSITAFVPASDSGSSGTGVPNIAGWYSTAEGVWNGRLPITVNASSVAGPLTDYPLELKIEDNASVLDLSASDGHDILFTSSSNTKLSSQTVEYTQKLQRDVGQSWHNSPEAIHYVNATDSTYVTWIDTTGNIMAGVYNHATDNWTTSTVDTGFNVDDHSNPSMTILDDGTIMIFYSDHNGANGYYKKSTNPEDISSWQTRVDVGLDSEYTYLRPIKLDNRIYLTWRGPDSAGTKPNKWTWSDDNGATWASPVKTIFQITNNRAYIHASVDENANRIDFSANCGNLEEETSCDIYHFYMINNAGTNEYYTSAGVLIGLDAALPITEATATLVYNSTSAADEGQLIDMSSNFGDPVILFGKYISDYDQRANYARWTGSAWAVTEIASMGETIDYDNARGHYTGNAELDHENPRTVYISRVVNNHHQIDKAYTTDNGTTWIFEQISQGQSRNFRPVVPINHHATELNVLWLQGNYVDYTDYHTDLVAYPPVGSYLDATFMVKVPSISNAANTSLYMYYGNPSASAQGTASNTAIFGSDLVYGNVGDSSYIHQGLIDITNLPGLTVVVGFEPTNTVTANDEILSSNFQGSGSAAMFLFRKQATTETIQASVRQTTGSSATASFTDMNPAEDDAHGAAFQFDRLGDAKLEGFMDGTKSTQSAAVSANVHATPSTNELMTATSPHLLNKRLPGWVDYVTVFNTVRSDNYILTATKNLGDMGNFVTVESATELVDYV